MEIYSYLWNSDSEFPRSLPYVGWGKLFDQFPDKRNIKPRVAQPLLIDQDFNFHQLISHQMYVYASDI